MRRDTSAFADFDRARSGLARARDAADAAEAKARSIQQRVRRLEAELTAMARVGTRSSAEARARTEALLEAARRESRVAREELETARLERDRLVASYETRSDPRTVSPALESSIPILLLPIRLETRFHHIADELAPADELWIRVYPDDCSVDSFEAMLSDTEAASGRRYWIGAWAAGGIDAQERAAWRDLCASHGSGRAAWILHELQPANLNEKPVKPKAEDLILVIVTDAPPAAQARDALSDYWVAVWRAEGDQTGIDGARAALAGALGIDPVALIAQFEPANLSAAPAAPLARADVSVSVGWLSLPALATKTRSWTEPPRVRLLPDRFVAVGYQSGRVVFEGMGKVIPADLIAGPDPSSPLDEQLKHDDDGELIVPKEMRWMVDFDEAVSVGMGIKVRLDSAKVDLASPIERLVVLGLRLAKSPDEAATALEQLLTHHRYGSAGLAFVPQGTPTNNTEAADSGYSRRDDPDASFDARASTLAATADWWKRRDGQWLADALGVGLDVFQGVAHASGQDQAEARALNRALWPATFGYAMETMLTPVFTPEQIEITRWFAQHFVSGRGFLPSLRIGHQPYGVLPISPPDRADQPSERGAEWPRIAGLEAPPQLAQVMSGLARVLATVRKDWTKLADQVAYVGKPGDAHQVLLDVIGLHPASVEFHQRYAESLDHLFNAAKLHGLAAVIFQSLQTRHLQQPAMDLLRRLGYTGDVEPDALAKFFLSRSTRLNGPIIDDRPLSEHDAIRVWTPDGRNYIKWLIDAARSFEDLRLERGFTQDRAPDALLFVLLRHALMLGYWDTSLQLHLDAQVLTTTAAGQARREASFVHVQQSAEASESRFHYLYRTDAQITQDPDRTIADHIGRLIGGQGASSSSARLADQVEALDLLKDVPTARLERCLAEHIDLASHRLDAWLLGLVHYRLAASRYGADGGAPRRGIHVGAYGCLEGLSRKSAQLTVAEPPGALGGAHGSKDPVLHDPGNGGFIFAPSMNQATTAAILRAGYLANASAATPGALAVNLSSDRVRVALGVIEGIRNGQPLGALLGYRLQRGLHERDDALELDRYLYALRKLFPLVADQMASTKTGPDVPIEAVEASHVVDGLKLVDHVRTTGNRTYPFGLALPSASTDEAAAISLEVEHLHDAYDALADLALAESVHQSVLGNYDQVGATLDAYAKGTFPPEPAVIRTPRSGFGLTHRLGLQLEAGVDPAVSPLAGIPMSPRAQAQAMVNSWLAAQLPDPDQVVCLVEWIDPVDSSAHQVAVTQRQLQLQPIDLVHIAVLDGEAAMSELDDRILRYVFATQNPRSDAAIALRHTARQAGRITFFELAPLVRSLQALLLRSRPLRPTDIALTGEAERKADATATIDRDRVRLVRDGMNALLTDVTNAVVAAPVDAAIDVVTSLFERAARFGLAQVGWGFMYEWRRRAFADIVDRFSTVIQRWKEHLAGFDQGLIDFDANAGGLSDLEQFTLLGRLDLLIAAAAMEPRPATPIAYRAALLLRRNALANKRGDLETIVATADPRLAPLLAAAQAALPLNAFDPAPFAIDDLPRDVDRFLADAQARVDVLRKELAKRVQAADALLAEHDAASDPPARVSALQNAGVALLGEETRLIPEFTVSAQHAAELGNALDASRSGALTAYVRSAHGVTFPVDDWLHGVARVREKVFEWEQTVLMTEVLSGAELDLLPVQLPYRLGESWLALEFDPTKPPDGERLLYTAHHAVPFDPTRATCGLLLDEWTEVIPTREETAGLAFHYDRPNSEPPQSWLLVTPSAGQPAWGWNELLGAIDEALALARLRAVEPAQVEPTPYARFLPATTSAAMLYGISIAANLARVNNFAGELRDRG